MILHLCQSRIAMLGGIVPALTGPVCTEQMRRQQWITCRHADLNAKPFVLVVHALARSRDLKGRCWKITAASAETKPATGTGQDDTTAVVRAIIGPIISQRVGAAAHDARGITGMNRKQLVALASITLLVACTQETQNKIGRSIQNWTGTDGIIEIYAGNKLVKRFIKIDKLSTAAGTNSDVDRPYRFGYGVLDSNLNNRHDKGESKVYFEFSDYSTSYVFFENPD